MKKCITALILLGIALSFNAWSQIKLRRNNAAKEDFEKIVLLSAIIDQCNVNDISQARKDYWQSFSKNYASTLIEENNYDVSFVAQVAATTLYKLDQSFGDNIPNEVCSLAITDISKIENQFKRDSLIIAQNKSKNFSKYN